VDESDPTGEAVEMFLARYPRSATLATHRSRLRDLFSTYQLATVTEAQLITWATRTASNNTIRSRLALARTFFTWTHKTGRREDNPADDLARLNKQYPRTYGKTQSKYPARFLTAAEAQALMATCDESPRGIRDALIMGFGLAGMRAAEIRHITWGDIDPSGRLTWTGKGNRVRTATLSPSMRDRLNVWRRHWQDDTGKAPAAEQPIVCALPQSGPWQTQRGILWGEPVRYNAAIGKIVNRHGERAGLGHVAPHDLRRSAASILHHSLTDEGGHKYDLLDIQRVLGHSDPATTMRSYLEPLTNAALNDRAASDLDF